MGLSTSFSTPNFVFGASQKGFNFLIQDVFLGLSDDQNILNFDKILFDMAEHSKKYLKLHKIINQRIT